MTPSKLFNFLLISFLTIIATSAAFPAVHDAPKTKINKYLVKTLPGYDDISKYLKPIMYAGHINLHSGNNTNYFFWKYEQKLQNSDNDKTGIIGDVASTNRLVIWLNGGPGCSSMDGALMEIGPLRLTHDSKVYFNNGTWLELASLVFLDQPVGTGFSYGNVYHNELTTVAWDFMVFLEKYFELFPNDFEKELYIAGESYAGQYMPYFAKYILDHNVNPANNKKYNLKGILVGNGWISPTYTGLSYLPFAMKSGLITGKEPYMKPVFSKQEECQNKVNGLSRTASQAQKNDVYKTCDNILNTLLDVLHANNNNDECINIYDVRLTDSYPSCGMNWPPDIPILNKFLSDPDIQALLNLNPEYIEKEKSLSKGQTLWKECNSRVGAALVNKNSVSLDELLSEVLLQLPVVLFNGDKDIICNYIGAENFIDDLTWNGHKGFSEDLDPIKWYYNNSQVGLIKQERNLTYVRIFETSHMVPFDMPDVSRGVFDLITENFRWVKSDDFEQGKGNQNDGSSHNDNDDGGKLKDKLVLVTPVYNISSSAYDYLISKSRNHLYEEFFQFRYFVYLLVLGIIVYGLFHYNAKATPGAPQSIMAKKQKGTPISLAATAGMNILNGGKGRKPGKKKSVQWADLQRSQGNENETARKDRNNFGDDSDDSMGEEDIGISKPYSDKNSNSGAGADRGSKFSNFLNTFGLRKSKDRIKYHQTSNFDLEEEIEMVDNFDRVFDRRNHDNRGGNEQFQIANDDDEDGGEDDGDNFIVDDENDLGETSNLEVRNTSKNSASEKSATASR